MLYLCNCQLSRAEKSSLAASLFEGLMMVISSIGGLHVKRWIAVEGHSYVPTLSTIVLHGSWIFAMNEIAQKCQLHKRKVLSDSTCSNERQTRGYDGSCAFLPLVCERALSLLN